MITCLVLVVYLLSVYTTYKYIQYAHYHPQGKWSNIKPDSSAIFLTFFPIVNTIFSLIFLTNGWKDDKHKKKKEFFKPLKKL